MKYLFNKYKHASVMLFFLAFYLVWFAYLERTVTKNYQIIHVRIDDYIPFLEIFVIPYYLWFFYVSAVVVYLMLTNKGDYYRACLFLFTGMIVFLVVSTLFPNGQNLRPSVMPRDNIFTFLVSKIYLADTPTNIWPSIHVFNSIGAHFAIVRNNRLGNIKWLRRGSFILSISIILSTVFIKQHSIFDMVTAFIMAAVLYGIVYKLDILLVYKNWSRTRIYQQ